MPSCRLRCYSCCSAWFQCFATYDPYPKLQKVTCPVLALNGSKDLQAPAELNAPFLRLAVTWSPRSCVKIVDGVNHLFQSTQSGSEYVRITETFSPGYLSKLVTKYFRKFTEFESSIERSVKMANRRSYKRELEKRG